MTELFLIFWALMIFASIAWYGFLLFYIGFKGGHEIITMTRALSQRDPQTEEPRRDGL